MNSVSISSSAPLFLELFPVTGNRFVSEQSSDMCQLLAKIIINVVLLIEGSKVN